MTITPRPRPPSIHTIVVGGRRIVVVRTKMSPKLDRCFRSRVSPVPKVKGDRR